MRRLTISPRIRADHDLVARLVVAGFAGTDSHDVEVHLKAAATKPTRWLARCREPDKCARQVNYRAGEHTGHCARTRSGALALAGNPQAHHPAQRLVVQRRYPYTGRAYQRIPEVAQVAAGVRYLVTLRMPADPETAAEPYPRVSRYERYKTAPPITICSWQEDFVHLAAHEARHTYQFRHGLPCSEIDAEHWAHHALQHWRSRGLEGLPTLGGAADEGLPEAGDELPAAMAAPSPDLKGDGR